MFENVSVEDLMDMAAHAGRAVAREFPGLEAEDLASEALVTVMEKADRIKSFDANYIYKSLEEAAATYAAKERYDYMISTSSYIYRPAEVRALLKEVFWSPEDWDVPSAKDDVLLDGISDGTLFVSVLDLQDSWEKINPNQRDVLARVFRDGDESIHSQYVTRAVDALTRALNWRVNRAATDHEGPGSRKAVGSAAAQHMAGNDW